MMPTTSHSFRIQQFKHSLRLWLLATPQSERHHVLQDVRRSVTHKVTAHSRAYLHLLSSDPGESPLRRGNLPRDIFCFWDKYNCGNAKDNEL